MAGGDNLFYDGRKTVKKDRTLREAQSSPGTTPSAEDDIYNQRIDSVYEEFSNIINTANAVIPIYEENSRILSIPVDSIAIDVRSAVKRKDQGVPDGSEIRFDLFRDAIENYDKLRANISIQAASQLDGNPPLDSERITNIRRQIEQDDLNEAELALFASAILIRYTLAILSHQTSVPVTTTMTAAKIPPGTDIPPSITAIIASIILQALLEIVNEAVLQMALDASTARTPSINASTLISQAKTGPEPTRLEQIAIRRAGEADYQTILEYSLNFISNSTDARYHLWLAYLDSKQIRNRAIEHYRFGPQYSSNEVALLNNIPKPVPVSIQTDTVITQRINNQFFSNIIAMTPEHLCALEEDATSLQNNLHLIAITMSSRFSADMICCLTRFFGSFDKKTLKSMKAIMAFAQGMTQERMTIDLTKTLVNITNYLSNSIRDFLMAHLDRVFAVVVNPLLDEISLSDDDWSTIYRGCPIIEQVVEFILKTINSLFVKLREIILSINLSGQYMNLDIENRYTYMYEMRTFKVILDLIDRIISALINNDCGFDEDGRTIPSELAGFVDAAATAQSAYTIKFPQELIDAHFSESIGVVVEENDVRPTYTIPSLNDTAEAGLSEQRIMREIMDRCGRNLSDDDLDRIFRMTNGTD